MILTASLASAALLLIMAGAAKVADPGRTAGALAALRWPASPLLVRLGAAVELIVGVTALVIGGPGVAMLVVASYLGFAVFVMVALSRGAPIGTCGCFGQKDTPPRPLHVAVNVVLALGAAGAAGLDRASPLIEASWPTWLLASGLALSSLTSYMRNHGRQNLDP